MEERAFPVLILGITRARSSMRELPPPSTAPMKRAPLVTGGCSASVDLPHQAGGTFCLYANIAVAAAEGSTQSYVGGVLRMTFFAPEIVEAILGGRQPAKLQLEDLLRRFPVGWWAQRVPHWGAPVELTD